MADDVKAEVKDDAVDGEVTPEENALDQQYPAGVPEGDVLTTTTHDGEKANETIRHDTDEEGNLVGWSKEPDPDNPHPEHDPDGPLVIPAEDEENGTGLAYDEEENK